MGRLKRPCHADINPAKITPEALSCRYCYTKLMNVLNDVITAEKLRVDQAAVFDDVLASRQPKIIVYDNQPSLILISAETYKAQLERLVILAKIETGRQNIREGNTVTNDQVIGDLQRMIAATEQTLRNGKG